MAKWGGPQTGARGLNRSGWLGGRSGGWGAGGLGGARGLEGLAGELRMGLELGSGRCALDGLWQAARLVRLAAAADPYQRQGCGVPRRRGCARRGQACILSRGCPSA